MELKKVFRYCKLRYFLYSLNGSGLYPTSVVRKCALVTGVSYNTLRTDLSLFSSMGLLIKGNGFIKLNRLNGPFKRVYSLYQTYLNEIENSEVPAIYFADLYKRKMIFANVLGQSLKEAEKIHDQSLKDKFLRLVKGSTTPIGARQGIFLSIRTIGKIFGRSKTTAFKYIERMNSTALINRVRNVSMPLCDLSRLNEFRKEESLYGRLFVENGLVFERLQNSYKFNF